MKLCKVCGQLKDLSDFYKNGGKSDGCDYSCKICKKQYNKVRYRKMYPKIKQIHKLHKKKRSTGLHKKQK